MFKMMLVAVAVMLLSGCAGPYPEPTAPVDGSFAEELDPGFIGSWPVSVVVRKIHDDKAEIFRYATTITIGTERGYILLKGFCPDGTGSHTMEQEPGRLATVAVRFPLDLEVKKFCTDMTNDTSQLATNGGAFVVDATGLRGNLGAALYFAGPEYREAISVDVVFEPDPQRTLGDKRRDY